MFYTNTRTYYDDVVDVYHMVKSNENTTEMLDFLDINYLHL